MVRVLLWKEWREQAAILIALVALGAGVLAVTAALGEAPTSADPFSYVGYQDPPRLAAIMLAMTAGVVVGGALFAGEREAGTFEYLDTLPPPRRKVWAGKVTAGAVLAAGAAGCLIAAAAALGALGQSRDLAAWCVWVSALSLTVFAWGAFGSALMKSTLTACGVGIAASLPFLGLSLLVAQLLASVFVERMAGTVSERAVLPAALFLLAFSGLLLSAFAFTRPDRLRREAYVAPGVKGTARTVNRRFARKRSGFGFRSLLWLSFWQLIGPAVVLLPLAAAAGFGLAFVPPAYAIWPGLSLFFAALVGVLGWGDERGGAYRFWGERRLPVGRLWLAKVAAGAGLTFAVLLVLGLPNFLINVIENKEIGAFFRAGFLSQGFDYGPRNGTDPRQFFQFLLVWPVYGFAAGHLCGKLFKKAVVGIGVAVLGAGGLAAMWFPSFVVGGLHEWQLLPPPLLALGLAWWLGRAWTTDRLGHRRSVTALVVAGLLGFCAVGFGLYYRVAEVGIAPEINDDLTFAATVPNVEQNQSGRETKQALESLASLLRSLVLRRPDEPLFPDDPELMKSSGVGSLPQFSYYLPAIIARHGYPENRPDFDRWMDEAFAGGWDRPVLSAESKPMGPVEDPTTQPFYAMIPHYEAMSNFGPLLLTRGLREQARGNPKGFVRDLAATLAAGRNLRFKTTRFLHAVGRREDTRAAQATERFLERFNGPPEVLADLAAVWEKHAKLTAGMADETWLAERTLARTAATNPSLWSQNYLTMVHGTFKRGKTGVADEAKAEGELIGFAFAVPWEKERLRRVVGVGNDPLRQQECEDLTRGGILNFATVRFGGTSIPERPVAETRASQLRVAVRQYMAANGGVAPKTLGELVPKYLPAVPADPFDGKPFRYRVSAGETVFLEQIQPANPAGYESFVPDPFREIGEAEATAHAAVGGGLLRFARPLPGPPGVDDGSGPGPAGGGPGGFGDEDHDAVAAMAGGLIQWPFRPLTKESLAIDGRDPQFEDATSLAPRREPPPEPEKRRAVAVKPGQPVLWSVGPDGVDDGGKEQSRENGFRSADVDLIYIVPLTPIPEEKK